MINQSKLKKDPERKETFNLFIKRNTYNDDYIKISLKYDENKERKAYVKTIFITRVYKW